MERETFFPEEVQESKKLVEWEKLTRQIENRLFRWAILFYLFGAICGYLGGLIWKNV